MPAELRSAIYTVYAFCRIADDIADDDTISVAEKNKQFKTFDKFFNDCYTDAKLNDKMFTALQFVIKKYNLSSEHLYDIVVGVRMDLVKTHYDTFEELEEYCFKVAGRVAFVCVELFVPKNERGEDLDIYCANLGMALQLTNILRDIKEDSLKQRRYIPMEWLKKFRIENKYDEYLKNNNSEALKDLLNFIYDITLVYYSECSKNINSKQTKYLFTLEIIKNIYFNLFIKMRANIDKTLDSRVSLSFCKKLFIAFKTYLF